MSRAFLITLDRLAFMTVLVISRMMDSKRFDKTASSTGSKSAALRESAREGPPSAIQSPVALCHFMFPRYYHHRCCDHKSHAGSGLRHAVPRGPVEGIERIEISAAAAGEVVVEGAALRQPDDVADVALEFPPARADDHAALMDEQDLVVERGPVHLDILGDFQPATHIAADLAVDHPSDGGLAARRLAGDERQFVALEVNGLRHVALLSPRCSAPGDPGCGNSAWRQCRKAAHDRPGG